MHGKGHSYSNYEWDGVLEFLMKQSNKNPLARLPPGIGNYFPIPILI